MIADSEALFVVWADEDGQLLVLEEVGEPAHGGDGSPLVFEDRPDQAGIATMAAKYGIEIPPA